MVSAAAKVVEATVVVVEKAMFLLDWMSRMACGVGCYVSHLATPVGPSEAMCVGYNADAGYYYRYVLAETKL